MVLESEPLWDRVRRELTGALGGRWGRDSQHRMMGMNTAEWTSYMADHLGVNASPREIEDEVVRRLSETYRERVPLLPGATEAVRRLGRRWPLAVASSSPRRLIEVALDAADLLGAFTTLVSSEEVPRGKPEPDVFVEAARRLGQPPGSCVAVEDSTNGLLAAAASGAAVVAIPNPDYPPSPAARAASAAELPSIAWLWPRTVERAFAA